MKNPSCCKECAHFRATDNCYGGRCIHPKALEKNNGTLAREAGTAPVFRGYCVPRGVILSKCTVIPQSVINQDEERRREARLRQVAINDGSIIKPYSRLDT